MILKDSVPEVVIVRPGWFAENWASALDTIRSNPQDPYFDYHFSPVEHKIRTVRRLDGNGQLKHSVANVHLQISLQDVSKICADQIRRLGSALPARPYVLDLHGPRAYSGLDIQQALEEAVGVKARIHVIQPKDLFDHYSEKLPANMAQEVTEMTVAANGGGLLSTDELESKDQVVVRGSIELVDILKQLASGAVSKVASGAF